MLLNFIFAHLNIIAIGAWMVFFCIVLVRFIRPLWVKNISYKWFIVGAVVFHIFYAIFVTWGQYHIWAISSDFTRALLSAPLPVEAPLPAIFEWARPYFSHSLGYFAYYAFGRFFFNIIVLFTVAGIFYVIFKILHLRQNNNEVQLPELLCVLLLIVGWPGIAVLVPLGFVVAIIFSIGALIFFRKNQTTLAPAFIVATPITLLGSTTILTLLHLYPLLKI